MSLAFLLLFLSSFAAGNAHAGTPHAGPAFERLQAASQANTSATLSRVFDGMSPILAEPVVIATTAVKVEPEPEPPAKTVYYHPTVKIARHEPEIHDVPRYEYIPAGHAQENDPVWAGSTGGQIISSSTSLMNSVTLVPEMAAMGPVGYVLGGLFAACAAVVAVQAGVETYKVIKRAYF